MIDTASASTDPDAVSLGWISSAVIGAGIFVFAFAVEGITALGATVDNESFGRGQPQSFGVLTPFYRGQTVLAIILESGNNYAMGTIPGYLRADPKTC